MPDTLAEGSSCFNDPVSEEDRNKINLHDCMNPEFNENVAQEVVIDDNMNVPEDKVRVPDEGTDNNVSTDGIEPETTAPSEEPNKKEDNRNSMQLDKFKRRLVRAVARLMKQKPAEEMWTELKKEIGCDCEMLWQHMRALTLKKLKRLLPANDLLKNLKKIARFTATDWLLFDLILVHEKVNVISIDGETAEIENKQEPQCLYDLFELVKEHNVENLYGDDLTEAWIRVTLSYNSRGRQCSPMLLQLRWYQMKELTRARFYNFWCTYRGNHKVLDRAMKLRPTVLQTLIAGEYKYIITEIYPEWEKLIEKERVILSEKFTVNRKTKQKEKEPREGDVEGKVEENDVELEVIEPHVETIDLAVDCDEEPGTKNVKISHTEKSIQIEENTTESTRDSDENKKCSKNASDNISTNKSESEDEVLELDGMSDIEETNILLENPQTLERYENPDENTEEISEGIVSGTLPKITNVMGNVVEQTQLSGEQETNIVIEKNKRDELEDVITDTTIVENQCLETEDTSAVQYDTDNEINDILREKVNNLMNIEITQIKSECDQVSNINKINTKTSKNLQNFEEFNSVNDPSCSGNKLPLRDSEDEIEELIQEKVNKYTSIRSSQSNFENTEESHHDSPKTPETIEKNQYTNEPVHSETDEEDGIVQEEEIIKKNTYDDDLDEVNLDDDLIEFEDDGIKFVEEAEGDKKMETVSDSENESTTKIDDYSKIDLKLLMNPTVYTIKLDQMDIFKCTDYELVNDKKVIESAILESKPVDKLVLKDEDVIKFREQVIRGYDKGGVQSDNDEGSTSGYTSDRVKCTSWMLQKPKNRTYNPIKLCKNPDFNTRLKRLTAGFFSSSRNRELLKECKPLTIDLHKAFENKLINGTMYLKGDDFKAASCITVDKINNEPVSVLPSVIPGQSMIFTTSTANNASIVVPMQLNNQEDNLSLPPTPEKNTFNERSKIINLPDIDQVRRVNQSLLTAEVTPIRIDNTINDPDVCIQPEKASTVEPELVQPIVVVPIAQIKNEPSDLNLDDKNNMQLQLDKPLYEPSSRQDLMANKINDQIINLSSQISEVEKNDLLAVGVEKTSQKQTPQKQIVGKPNVNRSKPPPTVNTLTCMPTYRGNLTWSPKYPRNHIADSLLTLDTLSKILFLLNGNEDEIKNGSCNKKVFKKFLHKLQQNDAIINESTNYGNKELQFAVTKDKDKDNITDSSIDNKGEPRTKDSCQGAPKKKMLPKLIRKRQPPPITNKYFGIYCCWAREKLISVNANKVEPGKHGCFGYKCQCCCREQLIQWLTQKNERRKGNKSRNIPSTIVLSDDEDVTKVSQKSQGGTMSDAKSNRAVGERRNSENKSGTPSIIIGQSNEVTFELMPPLATITKTPMCTKATNTVKIKNIATESKASQALSNDNVRKISHQDKDLLKKPKLCKTVVYSAPSYDTNENKNYTASKYNPNQSTEFNSSIGKGKSVLLARNSVKASGKIDKETPKPSERTVFVNRSQFLNKPNRSPIYLARNKMLLCSLKNPSVAPTPIKYPLPVLPYGVNFVMLPNGELTLTVNNGVQLDPEQISTLSTLMAIVQEQYFKSNISSKGPEPNNIQQEIVDINTVEETNASEVRITHNIENKSTESNHSATEDKDKNALSELSSLNVNDGDCIVTLPMDNENEASSQITVSSEIMNTESECLKSAETPQETEMQVDNQITESHSTVENQMNVSQTTESVIQSAETCLNDNNDTCKNSTATTVEIQMNVSQTTESVIQSAETCLNDNNDTCKNSTATTVENQIIVSQTTESVIQSAETCLNDNNDTCKNTTATTVENQMNVSQTTESVIQSAETCLNDNNDTCKNSTANTRKTLLSDLMEMSGISTEDTNIVSEESNVNITPLPPNIIPVTKIDGSGMNILSNPTNSKVPDDVFVAGPYSNLLSFEPNTPINNLLNCIAQIRPELNAVTSFADIKYVHTNDGQFFKLDVDSGNISEIKVVIKNNRKWEIPFIPKVCIDLTTSDEETVTCAEFQDIPQHNQRNAEVTPIRLFKAIHPSSVRRPGRSILKENEIVYPKKPIRINKQRRKQLLSVGNEYVLVNIENKNKSNEPEDPPASHLDSSFDTSDEEPLAKKCKHNKPEEEDIVEAVPVFEDTLMLRNSVAEEIISTPDHPVISGEFGDMSDIEINSMDIEGLNPELHPVAFEEGSESDEDNCILGV